MRESSLFPRACCYFHESAVPGILYQVVGTWKEHVYRFGYTYILYFRRYKIVSVVFGCSDRRIRMVGVPLSNLSLEDRPSPASQCFNSSPNLPQHPADLTELTMLPFIAGRRHIICLILHIVFEGFRLLYTRRTWTFKQRHPSRQKVRRKTLTNWKITILAIFLQNTTRGIIKIKLHFSCEIEYLVETHLCKLCVILRSRVFRVVFPH